ncbi:MAG: transcription elongation factor GreA [Myxococcota bacterium]|nr:transcription elongation factor GreA [Myxococcota bacterium]
MERSPMTPEGKARLEQEVRHYLEVLRPQIVLEIEEARAHGDLSENAEYDGAKEKQALGEARLRLLQSRLAAAEVIDVRKLPVSERVIFGTTVDIADVDTEEEQSWRIVGMDEADARNGTISFNSPIARALLGRVIGDVVTVSTPKGNRDIEILDVHYK